MGRKKNKKIMRFAKGRSAYGRKKHKLEFDKILEKARREGKLTCKNLPSFTYEESN